MIISRDLIPALGIDLILSDNTIACEKGIYKEWTPLIVDLYDNDFYLMKRKIWYYLEDFLKSIHT